MKISWSLAKPVREAAPEHTFRTNLPPESTVWLLISAPLLYVRIPTETLRKNKLLRTTATILLKSPLAVKDFFRRGSFGKNSDNNRDCSKLVGKNTSFDYGGLWAKTGIFCQAAKIKAHMD